MQISGWLRWGEVLGPQVGPIAVGDDYNGCSRPNRSLNLHLEGDSSNVYWGAFDAILKTTVSRHPLAVTCQLTTNAAANNAHETFYTQQRPRYSDVRAARAGNGTRLH